MRSSIGLHLPYQKLRNWFDGQRRLEFQVCFQTGGFRTCMCGRYQRWPMIGVWLQHMSQHLPTSWLADYSCCWTWAASNNYKAICTQKETMPWIAILHMTFATALRGQRCYLNKSLEINEPTINGIPVGSKGVVKSRETEEENCSMYPCNSFISHFATWDEMGCRLPTSDFCSFHFICITIRPINLSWQSMPVDCFV